MEKQSQVIKDIFVSIAGGQELKIILIKLRNSAQLTQENYI